MENVINTLHLSGKVVGTPVVGHEAFGEKFYYLTLGVPRLSGAQDLLPVTLSELFRSPTAIRWPLTDRCAPTTKSSKARGGC